MAQYLDYVNVFKEVENKEYDRYTSFDYCYTYFFKHKGEVANPSNLSMSCFVLWSYLASWGMLRGSSQLLQKNPHYLENLICSVDDFKCLYESKYDFSNWNESEVRQKIIECYNEFASRLEDVKPSCTLITKIMLGVFGCVPALDTYFKKTFKISTSNFNDKVLLKIFNHAELSDVKLNAVDWEDFPAAYDYDTNSPSQEIRYTKAKMVDMYGFIRGMVLSEMEKTQKSEEEILHSFENGRLLKRETL